MKNKAIDEQYQLPVEYFNVLCELIEKLNEVTA